ncbi:MAG TPA: uracil-DNA glycosylase [bacterium]|jgi:uracil-DNA glycosylase family 4|nr:uracil-DNA glycosylase [bacterium]
MSEEPSSPWTASLAAVAARLGAWTQAQAKALPQARVRLDRPLENPALERAVAGLSTASPQAWVGGDKPRAPFATALTDFQAQISGCLACPLGPKRRQLVFGEGDPRSPLVFVGDAPMGEDDEKGKPFQGAPGQLLDRVIAAMGFQRGQVYLCLAVKCRPSGQAEPSAMERDACRPYLEHQLALLKPKVIVSLGAFATATLLGKDTPLRELRGRWQRWKQVDLMPTWHPNDLLRDEGLKRPVWDDMRAVIQRLQAKA